MASSQIARKGAVWVTVCTLAVIAATVAYLWQTSSADVSTWDFIKISLVVALVWAAIGVTMGIFIVMILKKNEGK